ncbi:MAG: ATP-binding cassette domain-containing protein, partial [Pseudomonadota bacterium]
AGSLPYGRQKLLELARALVLRPKILLLDEPVAALPRTEVARLAEVIREINRRGVTIVLVEHNMEFTMGLCRQLTVLNFGREIARGSPAEIQSNPVVIEAYLGSGALQSEARAQIRPEAKDLPLLNLEALSAFYGPVQAVRGITLEVFEGEIVAVLGPNGAGKSTTLRAVSGLLRRLDGDIKLEGASITNLPAHRIAALGVSHVPEGRKIFPALTVYENLEVASTTLKNSRRDFRSTLDEVYELFPVLKERDRQLGWSLSGGEQQMLAIARGLISRPRILLLDEPSLGLAPLVVDELFHSIRRIHERGTTILLVEQNAQLAMALADRGYVLANGEVVAAGATQELMDMEYVRKAYLGEVPAGS